MERSRVFASLPWSIGPPASEATAIADRQAEIAAVEAAYQADIERFSIHDIELGKDGLIYAVDMANDAVFTLDPESGERMRYDIPGGREFGVPEPPIVAKRARPRGSQRLAEGGACRSVLHARALPKIV